MLDALPDGVRLVRHIGLSGNNPIPRYFEAIFTAVYDLVVGRSSELTNVGSAVELLSGIKSIMKMPGGGGEWAAQDKTATIASVRERLSPAFSGPRMDLSPTSPPATVYSPTTVRDILNISIVERSALECKQGVVRLGRAPEFDESIIPRIMRTLTAVSNTHPTTGGYVILGIADRSEHVDRIKKAFPNLETVMYRGFNIVGIEREASMLGLDLGTYWNDRVLRIVQSDGNAPEEYRSKVVQSSGLARFEDLVLGVLHAPRVIEPVVYEGKYNWREATNTIALEGAKLTEFLLNFRSRAEAP